MVSLEGRDQGIRVDIGKTEVNLTNKVSIQTSGNLRTGKEWSGNSNN
jgi:hypothetical protein